MKMNVTFSERTSTQNVRFGENTTPFSTSIKDVVAVTGAKTAYDGEYSVTSSAECDITLPTAHKILKEDIKVNKIPYAEVSNNTGGLTVTIG